MRKLNILMSTYNGERYLCEQLDSIFAQNCEESGIAEFKLLIRDDGSSDRTLDILEKYKKKYPDKLEWYQGKNKGVIKSFFELMERADKDVDYYALSDQDDYWLPNKMRHAVLKLETSNNQNIPLLYCCRPTLTDEKLRPLSSNIEMPKMRPDFGNALIENIVTGCTAVFNKKLHKMIIKEFPKFTTLHDRWLYLTASCFGKVYYDEESYIYYRQHGDNVVGKNTKRLAEVKYRIDKMKKDSHGSSRQALEFRRIFKDELKEVGKKNALIKCFIKGRKSIKLRYRLVVSGVLYRQRKMDNRIFKVLILLNIY